MADHCTDNASDRATGAYWEREFGIMAAKNGKVFSFMQIGRNESAQFYSFPGGHWRHYTLPDIAIWTSPGEHHEIKHKAPTARGRFGLEVYRFAALMEFAGITGQSVMYTIHNHALSGGPSVRENSIAHWVTANVTDLDGHWTGEYPGSSWVNGTKKEVPIYYWDAAMWQPLQAFWLLPIDTPAL